MLLSCGQCIFNGKKEFEPDGDTISVTFNSPEIDKFINDELSVIHVKDNGDEEEIINKFTDDNRICIETDGFSVFIIIRHEGDPDDITEPRVVFHYINYIYTEENGVYTASTYNFNTKSQADPKVQVWTQIVRDGESLEYVPTPPDYQGSHFNGWYVVDKLTDTNVKNGTITYTWPADPVRQSFETPVHIEQGEKNSQGTPITWSIADHTYNAIADTEGAVHIYLAPLYVNYRFVNFYNKNNDLIARKLLVLDSNNRATMLISDIVTDDLPGDYYFMGWSKERFVQGSDNPQYTANSTISLFNNGYKRTTWITLYQADDHTIKIYDGKTTASPWVMDISSNISGNVNFYAEYEVAHWLRFIAGETGWGALYVPADYLVGNTPASKLPVTERPGYEFDGWYVGYMKNNKIVYHDLKVSGSEESFVTEDNKKYSPVLSSSNFDLLEGEAENVTGRVEGGKLTITDDSYLYATINEQISEAIVKMHK